MDEQILIYAAILVAVIVLTIVGILSQMCIRDRHQPDSRHGRRHYNGTDTRAHSCFHRIRQG